MKRIVLALCVVLLAIWWMWSKPPAYLRIAAPVRFDDAVARAMTAVDHSAEFAATLEVLDSALPGHDDIVFLEGGATALVSAMDGRIWKVDLATHAAAPFVDPPLMASGMHEAADGTIYFCASRLHGQSYPPGETVGVYRLDVASRKFEPVVQWVPNTVIGAPVVYADDDASAPELQRWGSAKPRPLAFCNDLELSADGRRIYFTEPFSYPGAAMGGATIKEAVSLGANGRLWRYELDSGKTRLIAQGFHFIDGVLYDLHPGLDREHSLIVSQTAHFRLTRFFIAGAKAGQYESVIDGLAGMPDGLDRDAQGRIWTGLLKPRSATLSWLHANPWIKPLFLRLPLEHVPQSRRTGVLVLSPDGATPLYAASYQGAVLSDIASAIPAPDNVYLTPFSAEHRGLVRLPYPSSLKEEEK